MVNPEERVDGKASNNKEGEEGARVDSTYHFALIVLSGVCTYDRNFFFWSLSRLLGLTLCKGYLFPFHFLCGIKGRDTILDLRRS